VNLVLPAGRCLLAAVVTAAVLKEQFGFHS